MSCKHRPSHYHSDGVHVML